MDETRSAKSRQMPTQQQTANLLQSLFPPQSAILVGANCSNPNRLDWQSIQPEKVLLIDAKQEALTGIRQNVAFASGWQMRSAVLAESQGEAPFFSASNPGEDGLVSPRKLASLWASLRTIGEQVYPTQTLQSLLSEPQLASLASATNVWLVIDCLPALRILQGAGPLLKQWKVLWVRVLLAPLEDNEPGTTLTEIERYLADHNYRLIGCFEENHPHIGQAIFLHDIEDLLEQENTRLTAMCDTLDAEKLALLTECDALRQDKSALEAERAFLSQANTGLVKKRDVLQKRQAELRAVCEVLTAEKNKLLVEHNALHQENARLQAECDALIGEKASLLSARDEQTKIANDNRAQLEALSREKVALAAARNEHAKLANERKAQVEALSKEKAELVANRTALATARDEQAKLANDYKAQLDAITKGAAELVAARDILIKEKAALAAARDEQAKLANERKARIEALSAQLEEQTKKTNALLLTRDNQTLLLSERDSQIHQFEAEYSENLARLRLMQDELVKGEAQIELIKDLLLRESGL